jgi:RNA methyltransferase, TrmH family
MEPGLSHRNPRVAETARLHRAEERRNRGLTLLEGPHLLEEAVAAGEAVVEVYALADDRAAVAWATQAGAELVVVGEEALKRLSSTQSPQSPVAVLEIPTRGLDASRSLLVAWRISDPGNLGTMIRTAAAFGLDVVVTAGSADPWSPKVMRSGMGGHFQTAVVEFDDLDSLEAIKVATVMSGGVSVRQLPPGRLAILIGSEAHGLPAEVVAQANLRVTIPMTGPVESLNAGAAATILAYEASLRFLPQRTE